MSDTSLHDGLQYAHVAFVCALGCLHQQKAGFMRPGLQHAVVARDICNALGFFKSKVVALLSPWRIGVDLIAQDRWNDAHARAKAFRAARIVVNGVVCSVACVHACLLRTYRFALPAATVATWTRKSGDGKCELKRPTQRCNMRPWTNKLPTRCLSAPLTSPINALARRPVTTTSSGRTNVWLVIGDGALALRAW